MQFKQLFRSSSIRYFVQTAVVSGCLAIGATALQVPTPALAQSGVTIFSGIERGQELSYSTDFGARPGQTERYYLTLEKARMKQAVNKFVIVTPDYFDGTFDPKKVEITVNGKKFPVGEVNWDKDNGRLEIYPKEPVPSKTKVQLILSNVTNPSGGIYYFNCLIQVPGDVPMFRDLGTWAISINH